MKQIVATIWKPTSKHGGGADNLRLWQVDVDYASSICARYYKGHSAHGANVILVIEEEQNADSHSREQS